MTEQTLLQQITDFCRLLRQMHINVTTTNQLSWCKSVELIDISEREAFYHTARTNLITKEADLKTFDLAFNLFWRYPRPDFQAVDTGNETPEPSSLQDLSDATDEQDMIEQWLDAETENDEEEGEEDDPLAYSVEEVFTRKDFSEFTREDMEKAREIVSKLAAVLATKLSRRKVVGKKGKIIDFRRSWRKSLVHGGEPLELIRKQQKIKKTKILLLCDVSGSMDCYAKFLIQFIYGMQQELREVEVAVFSTHLTDITGLLQRKGLAEGLNEVANVVPDWSGGTKIGESLLEFYRQFAPSFSAYRTVVILISDGWDRGDVDILRRSMEMLHRHAYRLIWLNPLLGSDGYQPICRGIRTALPYVDYFLPAHNLESLAQLTKVLIPIWSR
ncbi:VWA domain-containing protein [Candidatus Poribacteria bacterium]|nr:VWA domain-containing protein [Candidatus Poribacteria bacterium]MYG06060.1 VWA domain-containing protein [Candidatus Poribacteria bacterium]MYK21492.1 VWA domain-containing protein [Candidatus Poribacteria bacterium]